MPAMELFKRLHSLGVVLSIEDDRLAFDGPGDVIDDDLLAELRANRDDLLAMLQAEQSDAPKIIEPILGVICPWCRRGDRLSDTDDGLRCVRCNRQAFVWEGNSMIRADCVGVDM